MTDIRSWLESLGLGQYADAFAHDDVDMEVLPDLAESDLEQLGVTLGHRKKMIKAIAALKSVPSPTAIDAPPPAGSVARPDAYTPEHLARRMRAAKANVEGERKQVTILFADIRGSTELVHDVDPEEATRLLDPALRAMMEAVHRFEGTVNRVQGDGLMAMFGAPIAHEDHALRACQAALVMQLALRAAPSDAASIPLSLRVGLHSGEVVVRAINNDLSINYDAVGLTAHLAARMEQLAEPGTIALTSDTLRLVEGYVDVVSRGLVPAKGVPEPVEAFRLQGLTRARSRLQASGSRGLTPFVGRERELAIVQERFDHARAGRGQIVSLLGDAGIGKSRLLLELRTRVNGRAGWLEGQATSFGRSLAFHPLVDLVRRVFGIEEEDSAQTVVEKVGQRVMALDEGLGSVAPYVLHLLGVDSGDPTVREMDPQLRRAELFSALRRFLLHLAAQRPHVLVFEDLHWVDQATEHFLSFLVDGVPTVRMLLVLTYRPEYRPRFGERSYHTRLALPALTAADSAHVARRVLGAQGLPAELDALIAKKAEGNPFYIEEVVKSLWENGAIRAGDGGYSLTRPLDDALVPDSINDIIMARIDRLEEDPRQALQLASVIGREFTFRLLERISGRYERLDRPSLPT